MTDNLGMCACGVRGETVEISPPMTKGGTSRDRIYEITNQGGLKHLMRCVWDDNERRMVTTCLRPTIK